MCVIASSAEQKSYSYFLSISRTLIAFSPCFDHLYDKRCKKGYLITLYGLKDYSRKIIVDPDKSIVHRWTIVLNLFSGVLGKILTYPQLRRHFHNILNCLHQPYSNWGSLPFCGSPISRKESPNFEVEDIFSIWLNSSQKC
jgi:hypothetical protein